MLLHRVASACKYTPKGVLRKLLGEMQFYRCKTYSIKYSMKRRILLHLLSFLLIVFSCTREISVQLPNPVVQDGQISGKIILPPNTKSDTAGLVVFSGAGSSIPVASQFVVDTSGKVSTTVLNNRKGDVLLLGYNYPGQSDHSISSESTALALLMNTLTLRSLSVSGKLEIIKKIKQDPAYLELVKQITLGLQSGRAVTDTTNTALMKAIASVFKSSTGLRTAATAGYSDPVKITTANTEVLLQNNNVAHAYVAGVYKDNKAVGPKYVIGGRILFATSLAEATAGVFGDGYGMPSPAQFTLSGNGEYMIRIRSGKPSAGDDTVESSMARYHNVYRFLIEILTELISIEGCNDAIQESIPETLESMMDKRESVLATANSPEVFAALALEITGEALETATDLLEECDVDEDTFKFLRSMGKTFSLLGVATKFMTGANITAHTNDLFQAKAAIDTCLQIAEGQIFPCGKEPTYLVSVSDGDKQKGESGKVLEKPLKVKVIYEDGKPANKTQVNWVVRSGSGTLLSETSETNNEGIAEVKWKLGPSGLQQVEAYVNKKLESKSAFFTANLAVASVHKIEIISKNSSGSFYTNPIKVRVTDINGTPLPQVELDWVANLGVKINSFERFTNTEGIAEATIELIGGKMSLKVTVEGNEAKAAMFEPEEFVSGLYLVSDRLYCFVDINEKRNLLSNPFTIVFVDKFLIPSASFLFEFGPTNGKRQEVGINKLGEVRLLRNDLNVTQYQIAIFFGGQIIGAVNNVIIK